MPIPPRPIPSRTRPGTSVPRKCVATLDKVDWRAEISILNDYPRSLPAGPSSIRLEKALPKPASNDREVARREVDLEGLITDNYGKREKRGESSSSLTVA